MERVKVVENAAEFMDVKWLIRGVCALPRSFWPGNRVEKRALNWHFYTEMLKAFSYKQSPLGFLDSNLNANKNMNGQK